MLCLSASFGAAAGAGFWLAGGREPLHLYTGVCALSVTVLSLYSQCIAHTNDHLSPAQIVPASATLVLIYGIGFAISPTIGGLLLAADAMSFFAFNAALLGLLAINVVVRMLRRAPVEDQGDIVPMATTSPYATVVTAAEQWTKEQELNYVSDYDDPSVLLGEALENYSDGREGKNGSDQEADREGR